MAYGITKVDLFFLLTVFLKTEIVTLAIVTRKWLLLKRPRTSQRGVVGVWNITTLIKPDGKGLLMGCNRATFSVVGEFFHVQVF